MAWIRELRTAAGIVGALVGAGLIWWSVALGFTFFVLPIVVSEFLLVGALYLLRKALCTGEDPARTSANDRRRRTTHLEGSDKIAAVGEIRPA